MAIEDLGDNVRRRMKIRGLTIPELARRAGMSVAGLSNLLNGKAKPRSTTLIAVAKALDVPIIDLLEDAPKLQSLRFRTAKTLSGRERAGREQLRHDTAVWLSNYKFLEEELADHTPFALKNVRQLDPKKCAQEARECLLKNVNPSIEPIVDIAKLMEDAGVKLRIRPFGFKRTFGLSVGPEDGGPAIVVNSEPDISIERQIYTVAHELAHLLLHRKSYAQRLEEEDKKQEKEADIFAGNLLLPDEGLEKEWEESRGIHWVDRVLHVKRIYKVSYLAVLRRLQQTFAEYEQRELEREFAIDFKRLRGHDLKDHYEPDALKSRRNDDAPVAGQEDDSLSENDFVEDRFSRLVRLAYEKELISIGRAAEMLDHSIEEMRELIREWQVW